MPNQSNKELETLEGRLQPAPSTLKSKKREAIEEEDSVLERIKKHRRQMAGRTCIPDTWGNESMLKAWTGLVSNIDRSLEPEGISLARRALVAACRRPEKRSSDRY